MESITLQRAGHVRSAHVATGRPADGQDNLSIHAIPPLVRVMLVDSNAVVRAGVGSVLGREPDIDVIKATGSTYEAVRLVDQIELDVVLISDRPGEAGPELCRIIRARRPSTAVIVLSAQPAAESVAAYLGAGATSFLSKGAGAEDFAPAVRAASRGSCMWSPSVARLIIAWARRTVTAENTAHLLSTDEVAVIAALADGLSNKAIAARLRISERLVKARLMSAMRTLGADRRAGLVGAAILAGIISGERETSERATDRTRHAAPVPRQRGVDAPAAPTRVLVIDDRAVVRAGLSVLLKTDASVEVVATRVSVPEALAAIDENDPDVVVVDARHTQSVKELGRELAERRARTIVIGLLASPNEPVIRSALQAGVYACLIGDLDPDRLQRVLYNVRSRSLDDDDLVTWATLEQRRRLGNLRQGEQEVLRLLSLGLTNGQIATSIATSPHNVKRLVKQIYEKMGVRTRAEAVAVGLRSTLE